MKRKKISFCLYFLEKITPLSDEFKVYFLKSIQFNSYKKGSILHSKGEVCDRLYFIRKGMIRGYYSNDNREITTWMSSDNELVTSITGFFKQEPCLEHIQAIEDSFVEYITYETLQEALNLFPEMSRLLISLLVEYYVHAEKRAYMSRIPSSGERFACFIETGNESLINRAPKKYVASLLGIRPETFSRMLKEVRIGKIADNC